MKICPRCALKYPNDEPRCFVDGAELEQAADDRIGSLIAGRYLIEGVLGEGGMATVYRARHTLVDRPVAVKIMSPHLVGNQSLRERFRREAKNAAALTHPNIVEIYDQGDTDDGAAYMVMELLDGSPLSDVIAQGPMPAGQVISVGLQIAQGLARAHDFGVIHRDLKPENIFVCRAHMDLSLIKLLDFGIARSLHDTRLTNAGEIFGTPQYMAPERVTSIDAGASADLYALGVILFEMITGDLPFHSEDLPGFLLQHLQHAPPQPTTLVASCPPALEALILRLMEKQAERRPVDSHQVIRELSAMTAPGDRESAVPTPGGILRRAAPTLPPTTLERWAKRTLLFDEMLARAYPNGAYPAALVETLTLIRGLLGQIQALRSEGLKAQRKLEAMESHVREGRQRLGHAVHTLATDLSRAREAAQSARAAAEPLFAAPVAAERRYQAAHQRLEQAGGYRFLGEPSGELAAILAEVASSLQDWTAAQDAAAAAARTIQAQVGEVGDLEFQQQALRGQLDRLEGEHGEERAESERKLLTLGKEAEALDQALLSAATAFCAPLRARHELNEFFGELERETD